MTQRFALQDANWVVIIAIFGASVSLAGFTSKWLTAKFPTLDRFGFMVFLSVTTAYFCAITFLLKGIA